MKRLISISTTVRSPYRIPEQIKVIKKYLVGKKWNNNTMPREFMYRIIQEKAYFPSIKKLKSMANLSKCKLDRVQLNFFDLTNWTPRGPPFTTL